MKKTITLGISPCPNDTYIFHALLHGLIDIPFKIEVVMADVEELNIKACKGELNATKLSAGVLPKVNKDYAILNSGAALGWGCGPLLISKKQLNAQELQNGSIAIPGLMTTANMLLDLHTGFKGKKQEMIFSDVIPAVLNEQYDMGLIIHEGRFTYTEQGLHKIIDFGEWWENEYRTPLPLGIIATRRDMPLDMAIALDNAISQSIEYARNNPEASAEFIRNHAQELSKQVTDSHIKTFVNDYSLHLGQEGRKAIEILLSKANIDTSTLFLQS